MSFPRCAKYTPFLLLLCARISSAQFQQYAPAGSLAELPADRHDALERARDAARYEIGRVRFDPSYSVSDLGLVDVPDGSTVARRRDLRATVGAGIHGYLPIGRHAIAAAYLMPEYAWWSELREQRRLIGRYGAGVLSERSHLSFETFLTRDEIQMTEAPDDADDVTTRQDTGGVALEGHLTGRLWAYGGLYRRSTRALASGPASGGSLPASALDRDEDVYRAGLRYRVHGRLTVGLGAERTRAAFDDPACGCDSTGAAALLDVRYEAAPFHLLASLAQRAQEPDAGSGLVPYHGTTGTVQLWLGPAGRFAYAAYGARGLSYTRDAAYAYVDSQRVGVSWSARVGWRVMPRLFLETGRHDYVARGGGAAERSDRFAAYGTGVELQLANETALVLRVSHTAYGSDASSPDRNSVTLDLRMGGGGGGFRW